jgi:hypothetical protein
LSVAGLVGAYSTYAVVEYSIDGGAWQAVTGPVVVSGDGNHTVAARVTDELGQVSAEASANIRIDTTAPGVGAVSASGADGSLTLQSSDPDVAGFEYSPDAVHWQPYTTPVQLTGAVYYRALDAAGNVGATQFIYVPAPAPAPPDTIVVNPPTIPPITVTSPTLPPITVTAPPASAAPTPTAPTTEPPATVPPLSIPNVVGATPKIKGTAKVGKKLSITKGKWSSGTTFTYRWYASGKAIKGATGATLKLTKKLAGKKITVKVTGWKSGYTKATFTSKATKKVKR